MLTILVAFGVGFLVGCGREVVLDWGLRAVCSVRGHDPVTDGPLLFGLTVCDRCGRAVDPTKR